MDTPNCLGDNWDDMSLRLRERMSSLEYIELHLSTYEDIDWSDTYPRERGWGVSSFQGNRQGLCKHTRFRVFLPPTPRA